MAKNQAAAPDGTAPKSEVDIQLAMLNHYVYTHQLTLPDSEIWKALSYVEDLARDGWKYRELLKHPKAAMFGGMIADALESRKSFAVGDVLELDDECAKDHAADYIYGATTPLSGHPQNITRTTRPTC